MKALASALALVLLAAAEARPQPATLHFKVVVEAAGVGAPRSLRLSAVDAAGEVKTVGVTGTEATFTAEAGSKWLLQPAGDEWWCPSEPLEMPPPGLRQSRVVHVWRLGSVRGGVAVDKAAGKIPAVLRLQVAAPPFALAPPPIARGTSFDCPVQDGRWSCRVPVARLDFTLRAAEFAPVYLADVQAGIDKAHDVGNVTLRRGGTVVAWLDRKFVEEAGAKASAHLVHMIPPELSRQNARLSVPVASATFAKTGVVRLEGVPAGQYELSVTAPGFAVTRIQGIRVIDGKSATLQEVLQLERPITLAIAVDPPMEAPAKPWTVEVQRERTYGGGFDRQNAITKRTDVTGRMAVADQSPGTYTLIVRDSEANVAAIHRTEVRTLLDAVINVKVARREVKGRVTVASTPLPGTVWFGGKNGMERVRMSADDRGVFVGVLPRIGQWRVDVQSADGFFNFSKSVTIKDDAVVEIELPGASIRGRVTDRDGKPVPNAHVRVESVDTGSGAESATDASGDFMVPTVPAGKVRVWARDHRSDRTSARLELELADGEQRTGVELRLMGRMTLSGIVMSEGQPLAGAQVGGDAVGVPQVLASRVTSDANGRFELSLSEGASGARVIVGAGAHSLRGFHVSIARQPVVLNVDRAGGTVKLNMDGPGWRVTQNGVDIPSIELVTWMVGHGVRPRALPLVIPNMAAGHYRLCSGGAKPKCAEAILAPASEIELDVTQ